MTTNDHGTPPTRTIGDLLRDIDVRLDGQRSVLEKAAARQADRIERERPRSGEPHRDWHGYALGADLVRYGLTGGDAYALMAIRAMPFEEAAALFFMAERDHAEATFGELLAIVVDSRRDLLEPRGWLVSWVRRWHAYQVDLATWKAQPNDVKHGPWRERAMTEGQRELVRLTARVLDILVPSGLTRGTAADWLAVHGANRSFAAEG